MISMWECRPPFGIHYTSFFLQLIFAGGRLSRCHMLSPDWLVRNHNSAFEEATKRRHLARNLQERIFLLWKGPVARSGGTYFLQASYMKHVLEQLTVAMALVGLVTSWVRNRRAVGGKKKDTKKERKGCKAFFLGERLFGKLFFGLRDAELHFRKGGEFEE